MSNKNKVFISHQKDDNEIVKKIQDRQRCSEILAVTAQRNGKQALTLEQIKKAISDEFQYEHSDIMEQFNQYYKDARDATFLSVESDNSYGFILRPFLEYFVACRIAHDIKNYEIKHIINNIVLPINFEILSFVVSIFEVDWLIKPILFDQIKEDLGSSNNLPSEFENYFSGKTNKVKNLLNIIKEQQENSTKSNIGTVIKLLCDTMNLPTNPDLSKIIISQINLSYENLIESNFNKTIIDNADLQHCNLAKSSLQNADLRKSNLSFANLSHVNLSNAKLQESILKEAILIQANLSETVFSSADLSDANLKNANLSKTNFENANLSGINFSGANLNDVNLERANLSDSYLSGIRLSDCMINTADFSHAYLSGVDMSRMTIFDTNFENADLSYLSLKDAHLTNVNLSNSNLHKSEITCTTFIACNFSGANLKRAIVDGSIFKKVSFVGANLSYVDFTKAKIEECTFDDACVANCKGLP